MYYICPFSLILCHTICFSFSHASCLVGNRKVAWELLCVEFEMNCQFKISAKWLILPKLLLLNKIAAGTKMFPAGTALLPSPSSGCDIQMNAWPFNFKHIIFSDSAVPIADPKSLLSSGSISTDWHCQQRTLFNSSCICSSKTLMFEQSALMDCFI